MLLLLTLPLDARGDQTPEAMLDEVGFVDIERLSKEISGIDARELALRLVSGESLFDAAALPDGLTELKELLGDAFLSLVRRLAPVVALSVVLRIVLERSSSALRGAQLFCRVLCAAVLLEEVRCALTRAGTLMAIAARTANVLAPVLVSAMSLIGATGTASVLSPMAALCASAIENFLKDVGLRACGMAAVVAVAGNLSDRIALKRLFALLKGGLSWAVGILVALFMGTLSVQGLLGGGRDSAAMRTAHFAVENLVPVIGGEVSDTMETLFSSALAVKNAVGVTGMLVLLGAMAKPLLELASRMISMKLLAAVTEPAADRGLSDMMAQLAEVMEMIFAACIGSAALALLLIGAFLWAASNLT